MFTAGGCAFYPLGLSKEQWTALSPEQQAQYQARQSEIDQANAQQAEAERARQEQLAAEAAAQEQQRLSALYQQARYGDIITVTIQGGMVAFYGKRYPYEPVCFDLVRGETKLIQIARQGQCYATTLIEMHLSEDGNTFYFDAPARKRFVALNNGWERGAEYHPPEIGSHDGHSEAVGVCIRIRYRPMPGDHRPRFDSNGDSGRP